MMDILLDAFSYNIRRYYLYFLTLIRMSPWFNARERSTNVASTDAVHVNVFAQLMGQKFAYYTRWHSEHPDRVTRTPDEVTYTAALLIKEGAMTVGDLLPHVSSGRY